MMATVDIGLDRFELAYDRDCDRCLTWMTAGFPAFEAQPGSETPWAAHTVLCPACTSRMGGEVRAGGIVSDGPFRDRDHMLNCLLDAEIQAYRRPGMTAGELAPLLSMDELRTVYWQRKIRELAAAQGMDPDADQ